MTNLLAKTIGIAGCGAMGLPMAQALHTQNFKVCGFDTRPANEFADFSDHMIDDSQAFSNRCNIVICVVRDEKQVLDLCFDGQAIFHRPRHQKLLSCPQPFHPDLSINCVKNCPTISP